MIKLSIETTDEAVEALGALLIELGHDCFEIKQSANAAQAFLDEHATTWDGVEPGVLENTSPAICLLLENETDARKIKAAVESFRETDIGVHKGALTIKTEAVQGQNWEEQWQENFAPIEIGRGFLLCPPWAQPENLNARQILRVNPGSAFGTGRHESTTLCIRLMETLSIKGKTVLDAGCGSGILGIAALMLGADSALGVDIDENAPKATAENAKLNNLQHKIQTQICDIIAQGLLGGNLYELILANINERAIIQILPKARKWLKPGGHIIVSGLTLEQEPSIMKALRQNGYAVVKRLLENHWFALIVAAAGEDDAFGVGL